MLLSRYPWDKMKATRSYSYQTMYLEAVICGSPKREEIGAKRSQGRIRVGKVPTAKS